MTKPRMLRSRPPIASQIPENNQLPAMFADVRRGKALAAVVRGATVTDADGNTVDTDEFFGPGRETQNAEAAAEEAGKAVGDEPEPGADEAQTKADKTDAETN